MLFCWFGLFAYESGLSFYFFIFILQREDYEDVETNAFMGKKNLTWNAEMYVFLVDSLIDQMHKGQKIGGTFSKIAFITVAQFCE